MDVLILQFIKKYVVIGLSKIEYKFIFYNSKMFKQLICHLTTDFNIPNVYKNGLVEEIEEALWIGATIQQSIKTRRSNDELRKITELKDSEISHIQTVYNEKLTKLLDDILAVTNEKDKLTKEYSEGLKDARNTERDIVLRESDEKMRILKKEHEIVSARYESLEARRHALEESRNKDIQDATKRTEDIMQKLITSKEEQLTKMETVYDRLNETIHKQSEEISKLSINLNRRSANVKTKGSDYEQEFYEKLKRNYGLCRGFIIRNTSGLGHEMDFSMEMEGHVVLWEVKNYTSVVPKQEVDKFLRDLKENSQVKIGVMISRVTDIYNKNQHGNILTEFDNDKMMIYINKFEEFCGDDENRIFQMLTSLFRIWWEYHREENTFDRAEIIRELEKFIDDISKRRTEWRRHKAHIDELTRWMNDLLDESENRLDSILKKARNDEVSVQIPDDIFRESGEKETLWIHSIMKVCTIGGEIEVRALVELLGNYHTLSKDTIRSNIMSVIKDSAISKKGVVKYIKGISKSM